MIMIMIMIIILLIIHQTLILKLMIISRERRDRRPARSRRTPGDTVPLSLSLPEAPGGAAHELGVGAVVAVPGRRVRAQARDLRNFA